MNAEMLKGHLDGVLLATLEEGPLHGYAIIEAVRSKSFGRFDLAEGTIYPALHRLELAGLLQSTWTEPPRGRKRRVYGLTTAGRKALTQRRESWAEFSTAIDAFLTGERPCPA